MVHDIIVIGTSFGGISALRRLVADLPRDLAASIFIVQHFPPDAQTNLHEILSMSGRLPAILAQNGQPIEPGRIHVARPNSHLLVKEDKVTLTAGPHVNRVRPSIDVLFWSAAAAYTTRVIGILLTGLLDDGVSGLSAIKRCGGITVVQDPADAVAPDLPLAALREVDVDHILAVDRIARNLPEMVEKPAAKASEVPEDIMEEIRIAEYAVPDLDRMHVTGNLTPYTCPECGGMLWETKEGTPKRFHCHTGHSFSESGYLQGQAAIIENSLWSAIRYIQERINVLRKIARSMRDEGRNESASQYEEKAQQMITHVRNIRDFIISGSLSSITELSARKK